MIFMIPVELGSLLGFGQVSNMTIAILGKFENVRWNTSKPVVMPNILSYDVSTSSLFTISKLSFLF